MKNVFFKVLSLFLALVTVISLFVFDTIAKDTSVIIAWDAPAIPADVGETIALSSYSVGISSDSTVKNDDITWKYNGEIITTITPDAAKVYKLTAEYTGGSKNIYLVAKNKNDTDYVIYFNDFDSASSIDEFDIVNSTKSKITVSDGKLHIDSVSAEMTRVILPEWLGEFADYKFEASVATSDEKDTSRWCSLMYRIQGKTANAPYPYYHMCVRHNAALANGIEYAERTVGNAWNVISTGSYTSALTSNTFYTYCVEIKDKSVINSINGVQCVGNSTVKECLGRLGLQCNYMKMHIDFVKVSLQLEKPTFKTQKTLIEADEDSEVTNIQNAFTLIGDVTDYSVTENLSYARSAIVYVNDGKITDKSGNEVTLGENTIPILYCKSKKDADTAITYLTASTYVDGAIVSDNADIVKYARKKKSSVRGIIDYRNKYDSLLTAEDIAEIRAEVNGNLAKTAIIDAKVLNAEITEELRSLMLSVWVYSECKTETDAIGAILLGGHGVVTPHPETVKEAYSYFENNTLTRTPVIIGHRGNPTNAPENSISSYQAAYDNGADIVECDIYLSSDGELVIMHDNTVDRTTDGTGSQTSKTVADLKKLHVWGDNDKFKTKFPDETVPTLREMFDWAEGKNVKIFVEIKSSDTRVAKALASLIHEYENEGQISVISFDLNQLATLQKYAPEISCGYLSSVDNGSDARLANSAINKAMKSILPYNTTLNPSYGNTTKEVIVSANDRGITIWPWTYSTYVSTQFCQAFMYGYNGLTTNDAQYTKNTVKYITSDLSDKSVNIGETVEFTVLSHTYGKSEKDITANASVSFITGEDCFTVNNGMLTAVKDGTATLAVKYTSKLPNGTKYTLYTEIITLKAVDETNAEIKPNAASKLKYEDGIVYGIKAGSTVSEIAGEFTYGGIVFENADGNTKLKTGMTVKAGNNTAVISVVGDTDCDGAVTESDVVISEKAILKSSIPESHILCSADMDADGILTVTDIIMMKLSIK